MSDINIFNLLKKIFNLMCFVFSSVSTNENLTFLYN